MTVKQTKHTPVPWIVHSGAVWKDGPDVYPNGNSDGIPIAKMDRVMDNGTVPTERDANATFIVCACNNHDALLMALKEVTAYAAELKSFYGPKAIKLIDSIIRARVIIAKAEHTS